MAFTPITIPGSSVGNNTGFQPISFDQARTGLASINNIATQQLQQQNQQPVVVPGQPGQTAANEGNTGSGMFSSLMNNIKKVPGQVMSLANNVTSSGSGMNTAVQDLGQTGAMVYEAGKALNPLNSPQTQDQAMKEATQIGAPNPLEAAGTGVELAALNPADAGLAGTATKEVEGAVSEIATKSAAAKETKTAIQALTPKMTPTEIKDAAAAGKATVSKLTGATVDMTKDKGFMSIVNDVKGLVKGKSPIEDINSVRSALSTEATALRDRVVQSGKDIIYPFKELSSRISNAEEPLSLKGTPFEKQIAPLKNAVMKMAKNAGGKVSSLLDVRQEFDTLVNKTWPNLYDSESAPMRNAVTSVRNVLNDFIKENLPKEVGYTESLGKQTNFYRAIDNLATKVPDEIKNVKGAFGVAKDVATKAAKYGAEAIGAGAAYEGAKKLGVPLP